MPKAKTTPRKAAKNLTAAQEDVSARFNAMMTNEFPLPEVDGITFRWVNADQRNKRGWGIWSPVKSETELGETVLAHLKESPSFEANPSLVDGTLFRKGDNTLAWAETAMTKELRKHLGRKAQGQLSSIIEEHDTVRNVQQVRLVDLDDPNE